MLHLVAWKLVTVGTVLDAPLFCARPSLTFLIRNSPIAETAIALDVFGGIVLVPKDPPPAIDQLLPDGGIFRTRCAKVTIVTAIAYHAFHFGPSSF
jgi:hypothetical protein